MDGFDGFLPLQASRDAEAVRGADVVLFCVKSGDTDAAGREIAPFLADGCTVLSLQNGVDNAERLSSVLAGPPVLPAVVYVAAEMAGAGVARAVRGIHHEKAVALQGQIQRVAGGGHGAFAQVALHRHLRHEGEKAVLHRAGDRLAHVSLAPAVRREDIAINLREFVRNSKFSHLFLSSF